MRHPRPVFWLIPVVLFSMLAPGSSLAQSSYRYSIGLMAGFGGATGSEPAGGSVGEPFLRDDRFELGYQLVFDMELERGILFGVRLGQLDVELVAPALPLPGPIQSELTYATLAGEYRLSGTGGFYQSGLYLGTGFYAIDGQGFVDDDSGLGLNVGATGNFRLTDRLGLKIEFSGHYADLDYAQFFIMGHAGLAFHF